MNALEYIRRERNLTYAALAALAKYKRHSAWKHCHAVVIPDGAAARYARGLGIDPAVLRPDVFEPVAAATA